MHNELIFRDGKPAGKLSYLTSPRRGNSTLEALGLIPHRFLAWLMTHTFGLKLVYPGSIRLNS